MSVELKDLPPCILENELRHMKKEQKNKENKEITFEDIFEKYHETHNIVDKVKILEECEKDDVIAIREIYIEQYETLVLKLLAPLVLLNEMLRDEDYKENEDKKTEEQLSELFKKVANGKDTEERHMILENENKYTIIMIREMFIKQYLNLYSRILSNIELITQQIYKIKN